MPNTFASLHFHLVFSTSGRAPWIRREWETRIWQYLGGILTKNGASPLQIGGVDDHVHIVVSIPPTLALSELMRFLKGGSSRWIHTEFPELRDFAWQDGYGAFSVSKSALPSVIDYVTRQREHHQERPFSDECLALLTKHGIEFDARYVFD